MEDTELQQKNSENKIPGIRTYGSDMADAIRTNETSVIKIALAEQKKRERGMPEQETIKTKTSNVFLIVGGTILFILGVIAVSIAVNQKQTIPPEITRDVQTIVSYDSTLYRDTTSISGRTAVTDGIKKDIREFTTVGFVRALFLTKTISNTPRILTKDEFVSLLELHLPEGLSRSLGENYLIGTYATPGEDEGGNEVGFQHIFILFQTNDYGETYASLFEWEKTLVDDMYQLFDIDTSDRSIFETPFRDTLIANRDTRVLAKKDGTPILYYTFLNKETFIITDSATAIKEIGARLLTKSTKPL